MSLSILEINKLKQDYNYNLNRYYNGCEYCKKEFENWDRYMPEVINILDCMNYILAEIEANEQVSENEKLGGFDI